MRYYSSTASEKTLSSAVTNTASSITLNNLTGLPASYPYTLVLDPDQASEEIVLVTGLSSGTTLNVTRGTDTYQGVTGGNGTAKQAHDAGAVVKHMITARDLQEPQDHIAGSQDVHGLSGSGSSGGDVVGTSKTQTLTNKTISSANNTLTVQSSDVSGLSTLLDAKANLASPALTGTPTAPTAAGGTNTTQVATTAFVKTAVDIAVPSQTGNSGKYLTTNGTVTSWGTVTSGGSGTVTSITAGTGLTGGTITTSGTIAVDTASIATLANTQTFSGNKTFSGTTTFTGNISANSLTISPTELGYLDGVTGNIKTSLDARPAFALRSGTDSLSVGSTASANETITFAAAIDKIAKPVVMVTLVDTTDLSKGFRIKGEMVGSSSNWTGIKITVYNPSSSDTVYYDWVVIGQ